jgi:hypothetical protein
MSDASPTDHRGLTDRLRLPSTALALGLAAAVALVFFPERWTAKAKTTAAGVLRPGQIVGVSARQRIASVAARLQMHRDAVGRLEQSQAQVEKLREENRRLADALEAQRRHPAAPAADALADATQRLLRADWIEARVLGQQARAFLVRQHILDVGSQSGVSRDTLVVDRPPALIDLGSDVGVRAGQIATSHGRVWGKVVEVGDCTSVVRTVAEPGYRDVVRLAGPNPDGAPRVGPQGVREGTGQPLARVRLVEATEPAALGDFVYSEAGKGVVKEPLLCGRVVRLERPIGAAYWEIWTEPALRGPEPDRAAVLRAELNPARTGACATACREASSAGNQTSEVSKTSEVYGGTLRAGTASGEAVAHRQDAVRRKE